ncbi:MAG TPA: alpha-L-rhamnosidase N-terminal domain-containing protein [Candidatus Hydrogenedentes bacterium]|nr:alpha-L-rhamnosidase N-terminal domain-containing protein [Candidatus Hydrogenedentota bacterium]
MNMRLFLRLFGLCACSAFFAAPSFPQIVVGELRCENLKDPLGIDCAVPRVSWRVEPGKRGLAQSAYQIGVFEVHVNGGHEPKLLWDSGKVESSDSHLIPLDQVKLSSGMECQWMVRIWDTQGEASEWSAPARFTVGPADRPEAGIQDWEGRWIGVDWIHEHQGPLPLMRHAFDLAEKPVRAYAHVCALGYYELYLNGEKIGEEVLSPAVSDYSKRGLYLTHDVTDHLQAGENCVGIWLGRGWSTGVLGLLTDRGPVVKASWNWCLPTAPGKTS